MKSLRLKLLVGVCVGGILSSITHASRDALGLIDFEEEIRPHLALLAPFEQDTFLNPLKNILMLVPSDARPAAQERLLALLTEQAQSITPLGSYFLPEKTKETQGTHGPFRQPRSDRQYRSWSRPIRPVLPGRELGQQFSTLSISLQDVPEQERLARLLDPLLLSSDLCQLPISKSPLDQAPADMPYYDTWQSLLSGCPQSPPHEHKKWILEYAPDFGEDILELAPLATPFSARMRRNDLMQILWALKAVRQDERARILPLLFQQDGQGWQPLVNIGPLRAQNQRYTSNITPEEREHFERPMTSLMKKLVGMTPEQRTQFHKTLSCFHPSSRASLDEAVALAHTNLADLVPLIDRLRQDYPILSFANCVDLLISKESYHPIGRFYHTAKIVQGMHDLAWQEIGHVSVATLTHLITTIGNYPYRFDGKHARAQLDGIKQLLHENARDQFSDLATSFLGVDLERVTLFIGPFERLAFSQMYSLVSALPHFSMETLKTYAHMMDWAGVSYPIQRQLLSELALFEQEFPFESRRFAPSRRYYRNPALQETVVKRPILLKLFELSTLYERAFLSPIMDHLHNSFLPRDLNEYQRLESLCDYIHALYGPKGATPHEALQMLERIKPLITQGSDVKQQISFVTAFNAVPDDQRDLLAQMTLDFTQTFLDQGIWLNRLSILNSIAAIPQDQRSQALSSIQPYLVGQSEEKIYSTLEALPTALPVVDGSSTWEEIDHDTRSLSAKADVAPDQLDLELFITLMATPKQDRQDMISKLQELQEKSLATPQQLKGLLEELKKGNAQAALMGTDFWPYVLTDFDRIRVRKAIAQVPPLNRAPLVNLAISLMGTKSPRRMVEAVMALHAVPSTYWPFIQQMSVVKMKNNAHYVPPVQEIVSKYQEILRATQIQKVYRKGALSDVSYTPPAQSSDSASSMSAEQSRRFQTHLADLAK